MDNLHTIFTRDLGLRDSHLEAFMPLLQVKVLKKKEYLIQEGSVCHFIGIVASGTLRSFVTKEDQEYNNDFYFDDHFVSAYTSFLTRQPTNCNIQALTDTEVHYITFQQYAGLIQQDVEWLRLGKYIAESFFIRKCKRETSFLKNTAAERLESALAIYHRPEGQDGRREEAHRRRKR
jgi:CRP-like cAMP-binding protein